jgi:hypothetical protein
MRAMTLTALALFLAGCSTPTIVNNDDPRPTVDSGPATVAPPPLNTANLVDAFDYGTPVNGATRYFFTTPSGRWQCAIVPRVKAGCEAASGGLEITGAPEEVPDAAGEPAAPTALVVDREGDAHFTASETPEFGLDPGPAVVLPFNRILAAAGFRCNVQEVSGISCLSEKSRRGFTFSDEGFTTQYTDVPPGAP